MEGDTANTRTQPPWLLQLSGKTHQGITRVLRWWSGIVCRHPISVILLSVIFAVLWTVAFITQFRIELDYDDLFTPPDAGSFKDKDYITSVYDTNNDRARILAIRKPDNSTDCGSRLLLKNEETARNSIREFFRIYRAVEELKVFYKGKMTSILDLWDYDASVIESPDFSPLERINGGNLSTRFGLPFDEERYIGKVKGVYCEQESDSLSNNAEAFAMTIIYEDKRVDVDGSEFDPESREWIHRVSDMLRTISRDSELDVYLADRQSIVGEGDRMIKADTIFLVLGFVLVLVYTNIFLFKNSCSACKMHMSLVSIVGIVLALLSAFGIAQTLGLKFNQVLLALPLLVVGLGIDDTFVIVGAYQSLDHELPVKERIAQTLERAGSSIFVTTATDCCAFLAGLYTRLPALQSFSAYAVLAIFFDFVYQVTFFLAFLVLEANREERYERGNATINNASLSSKRSGMKSRLSIIPLVFQSPSPTFTDTSERPTPTTDQPSQNVNRAARPMLCGAEFDPKKKRGSTILAGKYIPSVTLHPVGRWIVLAMEGALLGISIYGCTKVKMDFNYVDLFTRDGSALDTAFDLEGRFFFGDQIFFRVYTKETETDYFFHQDELRELKKALEDDPFVLGPVRTWYEGYSNWLLKESSHRDRLINGSAPDPESFNAWLTEYLSGDGAVFSDCVVFSNDTTPRIVSSKISAVTVDVIDGQQSVNMLNSIRHSIEAAAPSLRPVPYAYSFLFFDGLSVIVWETTRNVIMAAAAVFVINCIVLADLKMAFLVVSMVALTDLMLFACIWYLGLALNPITAIQLVLAVGVSVDYSAHITHSFLVVSGDGLDRVVEALNRIGGEVLAGAFTTWLAIVLLGFTQYYPFFAFFKMMFALVMIGAWHGLILLPVILSFIRSKSSQNDGQNNSFEAA